VLDLQVAQGESLHRRVGRSSLDFARAIASEACEQELWILLNGLMPESVESIRAAFDGLIPQDQIAVFGAPGPVSSNSEANDWRTRAAERLRESFIAGLTPDLVYIPSLIEGFNDDIVTSANILSPTIPTVVTLYDLIPLLEPDVYLCDHRVKSWYLRKLQALKAADLLLAASDSTRRDAIDYLNIPDANIITIPFGVDSRFKLVDTPILENSTILQRYRIARPFILCPGVPESPNTIAEFVSGYSLLPGKVRTLYQLVLLGKTDSSQRARFEDSFRKLGLRRDEVLFADCTANHELLALYSLCSLFVVPSAHRGLGYSALEAMACGAPTIGANTNSMPEVIGRTEALFDPHLPTSIADKLHESLTQQGFRENLRQSGLIRAKQFTWESSARSALEAFEEVVRRKRAVGTSSNSIVPYKRPVLAYVSPLPPQKSGISDYSAELLPELAQHYEIEVVIRPTEVSDAWIAANFPVRSIQYFLDNAEKYDRILYHFGNSSFHDFMFHMLDRHPGTVVLHDFYLGDLLHWMEWQGLQPHGFLGELYTSHGYDAIEFERREGRKAAIAKYPCNRRVLNKAAGIIVHSEFSRMLAENWYGVGATGEWRQIPHMRSLRSTSRMAARTKLGLASNTFLVCSFGFLTPFKLNDRLIRAWLHSKLGRDPACHLIFVGDNPESGYAEQLKKLIADSGIGERIRITGFASPELYRDYLSAADVAVQLRTRSRGETSGTVLDCIAHGLPTIVNAHGSLVELPEGVVARIPDDFGESQLAGELERLHGDIDYRQMMSTTALRYLRTFHHPAEIAALYRDAIEHFACNHPRQREARLIHSIASMDSAVPCDDLDLRATASAIVAQGPWFGPRQLLMDVSGTARDDLKTGIQRVSRHIVTEAIRNPPVGFQPETIYDLKGFYTYGRRFTLAMLGREPFLDDDPVDVRNGDVFLGLDICTDAVPRERQFFRDIRARNVAIYFVVYDLLPILRPELFPGNAPDLFRAWLETLCEFASGLVCISRSVADELLAWLDTEKPPRLRPLKIGYFHLGADIDESASTKGLPVDAEVVLAGMRVRPSVLIVGTIEPRKGHAQALAAFEDLWSKGSQANLVVVGHEGWNVESLTERMRRHPERGNRFFWLPNASDEMLSRVYSGATVLLAPSVGEGFGLPLIEGARHQLPIIARDLPVFREVAAEHAFYFEGESADSLASALRTWFDLHSRGLAPSSAGLKWLTWQESVQQLMEVVMGLRVYREWSPTPASTPQHESKVAHS